MRLSLLAALCFAAPCLGACSGDDPERASGTRPDGAVDSGTDASEGMDVELDAAIPDNGGGIDSGPPDTGSQTVRPVSSTPASMAVVVTEDASPVTLVFDAPMDTSIAELDYSAVGGGAGVTAFGPLSWSPDGMTATLVVQEQANSIYTIQINSLRGAGGEMLEANGEVDPFGKPILTFRTQ